MIWSNPLMQNDKLHLGNTWTRKWFIDFHNGLSKWRQYELYILMLTISFSNNTVAAAMPYTTFFNRSYWLIRSPNLVLQLFLILLIALMPTKMFYVCMHVCMYFLILEVNDKIQPSTTVSVCYSICHHFRLLLLLQMKNNLL